MRSSRLGRESVSASLPELRLAFADLTPREIARVAEHVPALHGERRIWANWSHMPTVDEERSCIWALEMTQTASRRITCKARSVSPEPWVSGKQRGSNDPTHATKPWPAGGWCSASTPSRTCRRLPQRRPAAHGRRPGTALCARVPRSRRAPGSHASAPARSIRRNSTCRAGSTKSANCSPSKPCKRITKHALDRYGMTELVQDPETLAVAGAEYRAARRGAVAQGAHARPSAGRGAPADRPRRRGGRSASWSRRSRTRCRAGSTAFATASTRSPATSTPATPSAATSSTGTPSGRSCWSRIRDSSTASSAICRGRSSSASTSPARWRTASFTRR